MSWMLLKDTFVLCVCVGSLDTCVSCLDTFVDTFGYGCVCVCVFVF